MTFSFESSTKFYKRRNHSSAGLQNEIESIKWNFLLLSFSPLQFNCKTICIIWKISDKLLSSGGIFSSAWVKNLSFFNFYSLSPCFHLKWSFMKSTWAHWYNSMEFFSFSLSLFATPNLHIFHIYFRTETLAFSGKMNKNIFFSLAIEICIKNI